MVTAFQLKLEVAEEPDFQLVVLPEIFSEKTCSKPIGNKGVTSLDEHTLSQAAAASRHLSLDPIVRKEI